MSERTLSELLERAADRVPVGAPPIPAMVAGAQRSRRRRALVVASAAAASVAVAVGAVAVVGPDGSRSPSPSGPSSPPVASQSPAEPSPEPVPDGMRLVGIGHAAVAVPEDWGYNATHCGQPTRDTVIIDVAFIRTCLRTYPEGVESVAISHGRGEDFDPDQTYDIDGVTAERQRTICERRDAFGGGRLCMGTVYLPSLDASFAVASSTGAAAVDNVLDQVRVLPESVGVPGYSLINVRVQGGAQAEYVEALEDAGLVAEIRTEKEPPIDPGYILDVTPAPGTILQPGDVVTMTVVAEPEGPADEVAVQVGSDGKSGYLSDEQVRAGGTIELRVGNTIWAYADGNRARTLAARLEGDSLVVSDWVEGPNYPNSWEAVAPGESTLTLTITADGEEITIGTVTVVVR